MSQSLGYADALSFILKRLDSGGVFIKAAGRFGLGGGAEVACGLPAVSCPVRAIHLLGTGEQCDRDCNCTRTCIKPYVTMDGLVPLDTELELLSTNRLGTETVKLPPIYARAAVEPPPNFRPPEDPAARDRRLARVRVAVTIRDAVSERGNNHLSLIKGRRQVAALGNLSRVLAGRETGHVLRAAVAKGPLLGDAEALRAAIQEEVGSAYVVAVLDGAASFDVVVS